MICKSTHEAATGTCVLEAGHEGVHSDGLFSWRPSRAKGLNDVHLDGQALKATVAEIPVEAKKTAVARKRTPKKEN